jgi:hypothetical protein
MIKSFWKITSQFTWLLLMAYIGVVAYFIIVNGIGKSNVSLSDKEELTGYIDSKFDELAISYVPLETQLQRATGEGKPDTNFSGFRKDIQNLIALTNKEPQQIIQLNSIQNEINNLEEENKELKNYVERQVDRIFYLYLGLVAIFGLIVSVRGFSKAVEKQ